MNKKLSIIIPSRNCSFAQRTVDDIFKKATGDIEVIVILDAYWPNPSLNEHPNLVIVHKPIVGGMRHSINMGANLAKGKYIMKCDDHCLFGESFDEILVNDMEDDYLVNPSRYSMDTPTWTRKWNAIDYLYTTFPYYHDNMYGNGMHGKKWVGESGLGENGMAMKEYYWKERKYADVLIDDMQTFQGSFWLITKKKFLDIGMLDEKHSDLMENEPQELGFKVWLSGGRCIVNKKTWYAHMHKSERETDEHGRSWKLSWQRMRDGGRFQTWYWMNNKWPLATRNMRWFVEHFWPIPGWPEDWEEQKEKYEKSAPGTCSNFRTFDEEGWDGLPL